MNESEPIYCSDCDGEMHEIAIIDKGHANTTNSLEYAAIDAKPSLWTGKRPVAGTVKSFLCIDCGLIKLYGVPKPSQA